MVFREIQFLKIEATVVHLYYIVAMLNLQYNSSSYLASVISILANYTTVLEFEQLFHSNCNIISGMYKEVGRWEGVGEGGG